MMINVIGLGYIGLPTALMLASSGLNVVGTDINEDSVKKLNQGVLTFEEKGMKDVFEKALKNNIKFTTNYIKTNFYIVTVPTPYIATSKKLDPTYLISAVSTILEVCEKGSIIVVESTVSPGIIDEYIRPLIERKGFIIGEDVHLAHAPERIIPGNMICELVNNSRTIGADELKIAEKVSDVFKSFCKGEIVLTDIRTAEMSKVVENTFRDVNIAFANELAKICRVAGIDVYETIRISNKHPRVSILQPGPGVGGHCISVDPWFLIGDYPEETRLITAAREVNDSMPSHVLSRIKEIMISNNIKDVSKVGLYGLTYKENVDDTRESPTLQLIERLEDNLSFSIKSYDPYVKNKITENQYFNFNDFLSEVEIVVIMVAHNHIKENKDMLKKHIILDTKNVFKDKDIEKL